jgi:hypothetical protein
MTYEMLDYEGYERRREDIDATILAALADGEGKTHAELGVILRANCVGNAKSDDPLELSYSSTGAILRTALNSLRMRGKIYDSWDTVTDRQYAKPFRFFRHTEAA